MDKISGTINEIKRKQPNIECRHDEPMKDHTSFKIGGKVSAMLFPKENTEATELLKILNKHQCPKLIIGNGSNLLVSDASLAIVVLNTTMLEKVKHNCELELEAEAGISLAKLAVIACQHGYTGLEFAHGIPGTLGGAVTMNAGAYGGEMKDVVLETTAFNLKTGKFKVTGEEHEFSYRQSRFSNTEDVVLSSTIRLKKGDKKSIKQKMDELIKRRIENQPLDYPSGGSTFKRPSEGFAAALIEEAGLKGYKIGDAQVSEKHTGFVINRGTATFTDIMAVIEHVQNVVLKQFGIQLELEVKVIT